MDPVPIWLVRHARPLAGDGVLLGSSDASLSEEGVGQARHLAAWCAGRIPARTLVCSPLARACQTAAPLAEALGLAVEVWEDLREIGFGRWEGSTFAQVQAQDPGLVADWLRDEETFVFPGGEAVAAFRARVQRAAERLVALPSPLAVCHGGVIGTLLCRWLGLPFRSRLGFPSRHATVAALRWQEGGGTLEGFNLGPS